MNTAILLSGGIGSRIPSGIPKQYLNVCGQMVATYALKTLTESSCIDAVMIVAESKWRDAILEDAGRAGINMAKVAGFVVPGTTRQDSVLHGLKDILSQKYKDAGIEAVDERDTVLVHDAARPLLGEGMIEACFASLAGHDGVMPVLPMKDTVYLSKSGLKAEQVMERGNLYAGQAPELFLLKKYYQANMALAPDKLLKINGSSEPAILAGLDIAMIPGDENNFKITTEADLERFRDYMKKMRASERRNS